LLLKLLLLLLLLLLVRVRLQEYDELPLTWSLAVCECLLSACLTFALLGVPLWLPAWQPYQTPFAVLWLLQQLWAVVACGCTSLGARVLSVYSTQVSSTARAMGVAGLLVQHVAHFSCVGSCTAVCRPGEDTPHTACIPAQSDLGTQPDPRCPAFPCLFPFLSHAHTQGLYGMRPSCWRLLLAVAVDALLVVGLPLLGMLAMLACRLLTVQRQSCGERLLRLQPMREVVRPMHFSPYSPAGYKTAGGIETGDDEDD
jgi:hypothetical protein